MKETWDDLKVIAKGCKEKQKDIKNCKIVLFGAGALGVTAYQTIKKDMDVYALADNNSNLHGKKMAQYDDLEVLSPIELEKQKEDYFVIIIAMARHYKTIREQLSNMEIKCITYLEYVLAWKFDKFEQVYHELLQDETSRKTYLSVILGYLKSDLSYIKNIFVRNQYFEVAEFCTPVTGDVFVDCGAYVGDTVEAYLSTQFGMVNKIYAFEPTEKNCVAMTYRMERLKKEWALEDNQLIIEKKIVGSKNGIEYFLFDSNGSASNKVANEKNNNVIEVESVSLDVFFEDKKDKPTFIKVDIEGSEMDLISGASNIIKHYKPRIAICVYHKINDLYEIPLAIKKINPDYKMELRHHTATYYETVLYCY